MIKTLFTATVAAVVATTLALGLRSDGAEGSRPAVTSSPQPAEAAAEAVRLLRNELAQERSARIALEARVAEIEGRSSVEFASEPAESAAPVEGERLRARSSIGQSFPEDALLEAGFARAEVQAYRERVDGIELERLYLRDRATREGWVDTPRYRRESGELFQALRDTREEFGDELYDWTLYSSGHPNRVRVGEVMEGSPADLAGLEIGDLLVRYGERKIFSPMELRAETTAGVAGETMPVEVARQGEILRLFVPRGPLGIRTDMDVQQPAGP